jgi:hypothetical protein
MFFMCLMEMPWSQGKVELDSDGEEPCGPVWTNSMKWCYKEFLGHSHGERGRGVKHTLCYPMNSLKPLRKFLGGSRFKTCDVLACWKRFTNSMWSVLTRLTYFLITIFFFIIG